MRKALIALILAGSLAAGPAALVDQLWSLATADEGLGFDPSGAPVGLGFDPNGGPTPQTDEGLGFDPDGKPRS